jgi:hypothetical protein
MYEFQTTKVKTWRLDSADETSPKNVPIHGTVVQLGINKVRILFPVRNFVWLPIGEVEKGGAQ